MKQHNYEGTTTVQVPLPTAFDSIRRRVPEWWAKHFEGSSQNKGDRFTVRFGTTFVTFEITELIPNQRIIWKVVDNYLPFIDNKTEWQDTEVVWEFKEQDGGVQIHMTHVGLTPESECFEVCNKGWNGHIKDSLYNLLTVNEGQPQ